MHRTLTASAAAVFSGVLLSSCVAPSGETQGFAGSPAVSPTVAVLSLDGTALPDPRPRPSVALAQTTAVAPTAEPLAPVTEETEEAVTATETTVGAATIPVASGEAAAPATVIAAAEGAPVSDSDVAASANAAPAEAIAVPVPANAVPAETQVADARINAAANAPTATGAAVAAAPRPAAIVATPAAAQPQIALNAASEPRRRTGLFATLFNPPEGDGPKPRAVLSQEQPPKPIVATASASNAARPVRRERAVIATASARGSLADLPGVDRDRAVGIIKPKGDNERGEIQLASAGGLARLAPNGLKTQHAGVDVKCLKPALVRLLKKVERKYGKSPIVTSGYRSPSHNRRVRGAKKSLHMYCAAADIQVPGVSKWDLAKYMRSMPGRGGVGTYCHTKSVHIDIGPRRDWNWRCRRR